jgi:hypothetical protein
MRLYDQQVRDWQHRRHQYDQLRNSFIQHLEHRHPGGKASITRVEHLLVSPNEFTIEGRKTDDPSLYIDLPETDATEALPDASRTERRP